MIDEMWASGLTAEEILVEANTVIAAVSKTFQLSNEQLFKTILTFFLFFLGIRVNQFNNTLSAISVSIESWAPGKN